MADLQQYHFVVPGADPALKATAISVVAEDEQAAKDLVKQRYEELDLDLYFSSPAQSNKVNLPVSPSEAADAESALKHAQDLVGRGDANPGMVLVVANAVDEIVDNRPAAGGAEQEEGEFLVPVTVYYTDNYGISDSEQAIGALLGRPTW